jgi:putative FmdB family regulatory protein
MPLYDYLCPECGAERAESHSILQDPVIACPDCGATMKRALTGGRASLVSGGKTPSSIERAQAEKDHREVAEAKGLVNHLSKTLRPKMKASAEGRIQAYQKSKESGETAPAPKPTPTPPPNKVS